MLTRDGERVFEVLLIAAGLAAAIVFQDDLPGSGRPAEIGLDDAGGPVFLQQARSTDLDEKALSIDLPPSIDLTVPVEQALIEAAAHLAELARLSDRC